MADPKPKQKPAAVYIRVSTSKQDTVMQRRDILTAAEARGFEISEWQVDERSFRT